ncbi:MAG: HAD family hydrolase [Deltaproteobacteria bacterium]|nr:HAD family hydrolase [Deltaproteobacteria bacterium]
MSSTECIVLDFDGTFTRVDDEAVPFVAGFREGLRARVGEIADTRWDALASRVEADPDHHGWEYDGIIVAPSHADPYIMTTTIAQLLLDELGMTVGARTEILQALYRENYPKSRNVFRNDARRVVEAVLSSGVPVFVVTNSQTEHVEAKLRELDPRGLERLSVRGDARKFVIAEPERSLGTGGGHAWRELWSEVPEKAEISGLSRPMHLRRGHYFDALTKIWDETRTRPENTLVCGDIFELDLALPARLGARVHLVARPQTPEHERRAARTTPGGSVSQELVGLLERLALPG